MLGRLFGRTKDDRDDTVCSACGRHLLAGEWTQRVVEDDGSERYICALCARAAASPGFSTSVIERADDVATVTPGRVKPARADSDAFWRALKDKDAEIERLQAQLARAEAENQELVAQLARLRGESPVERRAEDASQATGSAAEIGAETIEYTPADLAEIDALAATPAPAERADPPLGDALRADDTWGDARAAAGASGHDAPGESSVFDVGGAAVAEHPGVPAVSPVAPAVSPFDSEATGELGHAAEAPAPSQGGNGRSDEPAPAAPDADDELVPLTILQRGVDLLNVSAVPKRIVETNEHLGIPQVHVGSENESTLLITFMWSMGWYQFRVELEGAGRITLADRGYDERVDLRPNASARNDGTVQLAPTRVKPPTPHDGGSGSGDPATTGVTRGVIISKSMKGQRTDDENVPADWKTKSAPDFDWGR
jgi:hypothetical protein